VTYFQRLLRVEIAAQVALIGYALLFAAVFLVIALNDSGSEIEGATTSLETALAGGLWIALIVYLCIVGSVALLIAPTYAFMEARGSINLITVAIVGSIPGAAVLLYSATPFALSSTSVALQLACLVTGMAVAFGIYLVRTWRTEETSAA
jgi:hypothetical protein